MNGSIIDSAIDELRKTYPWFGRIVDSYDRVIAAKDTEIAQLRTNVRHWREECGKLSAQAKASREWQTRFRALEATKERLLVEIFRLNEELRHVGRGLP